MRRALWLVPAFLLLTTCAGLPQMTPADGTTVARIPLPAFPKWVPTQKGVVPVVLVHHLKCNTIPALGCYIYLPPTIQIEDTLVLWQRWLILRHEIVHAAVHNAGLTFDSRDDENRVADALAAQQMGEMLSGWPR
jgi:Zn-dependent peptidase ImmA (M78 family)